KAERWNEEEDSPEQGLVLTSQGLGHFLGSLVEPISGINAQGDDVKKHLYPHVTSLDFSGNSHGARSLQLSLLVESDQRMSLSFSLDHFFSTSQKCEQVKDLLFETAMTCSGRLRERARWRLSTARSAALRVGLSEGPFTWIAFEKPAR